MTIYIEVLTKLIREKLTPELGRLNSQKKAGAFGYNHELSEAQLNIIFKLSEDIARFGLLTKSDDATSTLDIRAILTQAHKQIQSVRTSYGEACDEGKTISCLNKLLSRTEAFYEKISRLRFNLLDKELEKTPDSLVYYTACYYLGEILFWPNSRQDNGVRESKEEKLVARLVALSEIVRPEDEYDLENNRKRTLGLLHDLHSDNREVIEAASPIIPLPKFSFWGAAVKPPTEWFAPGTGRLSALFNLVVKDIKAMQPETAACPIKQSGLTDRASRIRDDESNELEPIFDPNTSPH
jgi:hypothetical protein